jgi:DNA-binding response OmpR family regulator
MKRNILVVEDDRHLRQMIEDILETEGFEVHSAGNGKDAMNLLKAAAPERRPHLIVLDLMLPKMNGWDFRAELQENAAFSEIPVLAMSGIGSDLTSFAADAHLHKPLDLETFLSTVHRLCAPATQHQVH